MASIVLKICLLHIIILQIQLFAFIGCNCIGSKEAPAILQQDVALLLADLAAEVLPSSEEPSSSDEQSSSDETSSSSQAPPLPSSSSFPVEADETEQPLAVLIDAVFSIEGNCSAAILRPEYVQKYGQGMAQLLQRVLGSGLAKELKGRRQSSLEVEVFLSVYLLALGQEAVGELQRKGGQALGPLPLAELEAALNATLEQQLQVLNCSKIVNEIAKMEAVVRNIEQYSQTPASSDPYEAGNYMELLSLLEKNGDNITWGEFAKALGTPLESFASIQERAGIFENNKRQIREHNEEYSRGQRTYTLGINHFADTETILPRNDSSDLISVSALRGQMVVQNVTGNDAPDSIDYRNINGESYLTPVVDRLLLLGRYYNSSCQSMTYAFTAISTLEAHVKKATGELRRLAVKQCMDCATLYGAQGACRTDSNFGFSGWPESCYEYMIDGAGRYNQTHGIQEWDSYPLTSDFQCYYNESEAHARIDDWDFAGTDNTRPMAAEDEENMRRVVGTIGPVSADMQFANDRFMFYRSGVYYEPNCGGYGGIFGTIAGYDRDQQTGLDFWLVKNHFGLDWGEAGYYRMARNLNNSCAITSDATYPIINGPAGEGSSTVPPPSSSSAI